jgi:hypothetical protein
MFSKVAIAVVALTAASIANAAPVQYTPGPHTVSNQDQVHAAVSHEQFSELMDKPVSEMTADEIEAFVEQAKHLPEPMNAPDQVAKRERRDILSQSNKDHVRWTDGVIPYEIDMDTSSRTECFDVTGNCQADEYVSSSRAVWFWDCPLSSEVTCSKKGKMAGVLVNLAILEFTRKTKLTFRPKTDSDSEYATFTQPAENTCSAGVAKIHGSKNVIKLGWCWNDFSSVLHEMGHVAGLWHEQQRADRDTYITVKGAATNDFTNWGIQQDSVRDSLGLPYDFSSIMHYPLGTSAEFTPAGVSLWFAQGLPAVGQMTTLSPLDAKGINFLYSDVAEVTSGTCESHGYNKITDAEECNFASASAMNAITWGPHGGYSDVADGCTVRSGQSLFLNPTGTCVVGSVAPFWIPGLNGVANCECSVHQPCLCRTN